MILNNLNINTAQPGIWWEHKYDGAHDLTIVLNDSTTNTIQNTAGSGIVGDRGFTDDGPSLTITGSGILNVTGKTCGIWVWKNITICDSVQVNASGATYGIGYDNYESNFNVPSIEGGTVTLIGGTAAVRVKAGYDRNSPNLDNYLSGGKVMVGNAAEDSAEWKTSNLLQNYKYIKIEQGSHAHSYEWKTDADKHWEECERFQCDVPKKNERTHDYDDDSDTTCDTCGYTRTPVITIDSVAITITAPIGGDALATKASVSATGVSGTEADITWKKGDTPVSGKAGYNTAYTAYVTLAADSGYAFASGDIATINGGSSDTVTPNPDGTITVSYTFPATGSTNLSSITNPQSITGVANGTAKTATALGLPAVVTINTDDYKSSTATVTWDLVNLASGSYDPSVQTAQTFTVKGTVTLPNGINNPDNVSLNVVIQVTVSAASSTGSGSTAGGSGSGGSTGGGSGSSGGSTGSSSGGSSTTPSTDTDKDSGTKTETTTLPDGTKVETTKTTDETTGTTTVEEKKTAPDGTVTEKKTETKKDGSTTETTTTVDTAGTAKSTIVDEDVVMGEEYTVTKTVSKQSKHDPVCLQV